MSRPTVKAALFDMDGLMLDSENVYTKVTNEVLAPYGKTLSWELKASLMGRPAHDAATRLIAGTGIPLSAQEFMDTMQVKLEEAFVNVPTLPGIEKLVAHLAKHKIPIAIATGSKKVNYDIKTAPHRELFGAFGDKVICGDDPRLDGKGKPDPTIFLLAASLLELSTAADYAATLVFEDGAPGVRAAEAAGMQCVWVPDEMLVKTLTDAELVELRPQQKLTSLMEFKPEEWGLPAYD